MKITLPLVAAACVACALNASASETGTLSISGLVVNSEVAVQPDGERTIQRGVSTRTVALPSDENRRIIITAWD